MNLIPTRWYTMLVMPSCLGLTLVAIGAWLVWRAMRTDGRTRSPRSGLACVTIGAVTLYLASTPLVATWLAWTLERQTPFLPMAQVPKADAIVVLGGGQSAFVNAHGALHWFMQHAADRSDRAIEAFQAGKAPLLALGGGVLAMPDEPRVSDFLRTRAIERGVPAEAILICGEVRYTSDEGADLVEKLRERGVDTILLCTSGYHMPRARMVYEGLGMKVVPLPADFMTQGTAERFSPLLLVPRGIALGQTEACIKEWLGIVAGGLAGSG